MQLISSADSVAKIALDLGLKLQANQSVAPDAIIAEYLRQALCDRTAANDPPSMASYVTSITNNARRQLGPVWPSLIRARHRRPSLREQEAEGDLQPDPIRRVFETLEDVREFAHLGNGWYSPTPTRFVRANERTVFLISGAPTRLIQQFVQTTIHSASISRTVSWDDLPVRIRSDETLWQSIPSWLELPGTKIGVWTDAVLARAKHQMARSGSTVEDFEVYVPETNRSRPQAFRWVPAKTLRAPEEIVLCRVHYGSYFGARRYWLGTLARSRVGWVARQEYPVSPRKIRRLQYGLDARANAPTEVVVRFSNDTVEVTLKNLLPPEERRALMIVGRETSPVIGRFPMVYQIARDHAQFILNLFRDLDIVVNENQTRRPR
jgi:hypothetical protein